MTLVSPSEALLRLLRRVFGRQRIPAGTGTGDINGPYRFPPDVGDGGASVREPRRPKPAPPHMQAEAEEPPPETFLDLGPVPEGLSAVGRARRAPPSGRTTCQDQIQQKPRSGEIRF